MYVQRQGEQNQEKANAEKDLSHASVKAGPFTASSEGAVAKDDPNRTTGSWNQTIGSGKEYMGNLTGSEQLKKEGQRQNEDGKAQEAQGQMSDYASGMSDRVQGRVGNAAAALTGDRQEQQKRQEQHDVGKTLQRGAESDIQKQA